MQNITLKIAARSVEFHSRFFSNPKIWACYFRNAHIFLAVLLVVQIQFVTLIAREKKKFIGEIIKKLTSPINEKRLSISRVYRNNDWHRRRY